MARCSDSKLIPFDLLLPFFFFPLELVFAGSSFLLYGVKIAWNWAVVGALMLGIYLRSVSIWGFCFFGEYPSRLVLVRLTCQTNLRHFLYKLSSVCILLSLIFFGKVKVGGVEFASCTCFCYSVILFVVM